MTTQTLTLKKAFAGSYYADIDIKSLEYVNICMTKHAKEDSNEKGWSISFIADMEGDYTYHNIPSKKEAVELVKTIMSIESDKLNNVA